jgi:hypothetical protein
MNDNIENPISDPSEIVPLGSNGRAITIKMTNDGIFPPPEVIQKDIDMLRERLVKRRRRIKEIKQQIKVQKNEQSELRLLVSNPGIYDSDACAAGAERCEKHIKMYEGLIKKERAGIEQFEGMIETLEKNKCLSEMMSE